MTEERKALFPFRDPDLFALGECRKCVAPCGACPDVIRSRLGRVQGSGRVLNMTEKRAGLPELIVCPRCDGQAFDRGSCNLCGNCGYLASEGGERLTYAEMAQILATFSLATGIPLARPTKEDE